MHNMLPEAFQANLNRNPLLNAQRSAPVAASMALAIYLYAVPAWRLLSGWFAARGRARCAVR